MIGELAQSLSNYIRRQMGDANLGPPPQACAVLGRTDLTLDEARDRLKSLLWITYRKGFPALLGYRSDAGWGCMIRSAQMLLANVLRLRCAVEEADALRWFLDTPDHALSIHRLVVESSSSTSYPTGAAAGRWYGPLEICRMIAARLDAVDFGYFQLIVCDDGLYKEEVIARCAGPRRDWRRSLLVIPLRLGPGRSINPAYASGLRAAVRLPQSCGFIGGAPRSSLYIVGTCGDQLFYLDPHVNQPYVSDDELDRNISSFHCSHIRAIPVSDLDPCLALAFFIDSRDALDTFWHDASSAIKPAMFDIGDSRPRYQPPATSTDVDDDFVLL